MNNNRCLYCYEIIPEGRLICPMCERAQMKMGMILQNNNATATEVENAFNFTQRDKEKKNEQN